MPVHNVKTFPKRRPRTANIEQLRAALFEVKRRLIEINTDGHGASDVPGFDQQLIDTIDAALGPQ